MPTLNELIDSTGHLQNRSVLEPHFRTGAIPEQSDFYSLIHNMISRQDDGIFKDAGNPLCIEAAPAQQDSETRPLLAFYGDPNEEPTWTLSIGTSDNLEIAGSSNQTLTIRNDVNFSPERRISIGDFHISGSTIQFRRETAPKLNLYDQRYQIGVQGNTLYFRSASNFSWYAGGNHSDQGGSAGGGRTPMFLNDRGRLEINSINIREITRLQGRGGGGFGGGVARTTHEVLWVETPGSLDNQNLEHSLVIVNNESSSRRYKRNLGIFSDQFSKLLGIQPYTFSYKDDPNNEKIIGYLAEDLDELGLKTLVMYDSQGNPDRIDYKRLSFYFLEILKRHEAQLNPNSPYLKRVGKEMKVPNQKNTKAEIQAFLDQSNISYKKGDTKAELLIKVDQIETNR